jgi:hypothetical protein
MPRFEFALSTVDTVRRTGVVNSESFADALALVGEHADAHAGDTLEIGVRGFPPARFECVSTLIDGEPLWRPTGKLAA